MTDHIRWPREVEWLATKALRGVPPVRAFVPTGEEVPGAEEQGVLDALLRDLRGADEETCRIFVLGTAAGQLAATMEAAGTEVVRFWQAAGADNRITDAAAARIAHVAVLALRREAGPAAWSVIPRLSQWSESLRFTMDGVLAQALSSDPRFRSAFFELATAMVDDAARNPAPRTMPWDRELLPQLLENWHINPDLDALLGGLRKWRASWFGHDAVHGILTFVAREAPDRLTPLLARFFDPHSAISALRWIGVDRGLDLWRTVTAAAPSPFEADDGWNGSVTLPLLLGIAYEGVSHTPIDILTGEPAEPAALDGVIEALVETIAARPDAAAIGRRWGTWLVRSASFEEGRQPRPDRRTPTTRLLNAVVVRLPGDTWTPGGPAFPPEEDWSLRTLATMAAFEGRASLPATEDFIAPWRLSPEDWLGAGGLQLDRLSRTFRYDAHWPQGSTTRWLGAPFAFAEVDGSGWGDLWDAATTLREAVEFGDLRPTDVRGPFAASEFLRLAFAIGVSALDHMAAARGGDDLTGHAGRLLAGLLDAVLEMRAIDGTFSSAWNDALLHLAIRRALWSEPARPGEDRSFTMPDHLAPDLSVFFRAVAGDSVEVVRIAGNLHRSGVSGATIYAAMAAADLSLSGAVASARALFEVDPERRSLREVIDGVAGLE